MYPTFFMHGERRRWEMEQTETRTIFRCGGTGADLLEAKDWTAEHLGPGGPTTWQWNPHPGKRLIWFYNQNDAFAFKMRWC